MDYNETPNQLESAFGMDECELQSIYLQLCENPNTDFDSISEDKFITECIDQCYDKEFKHISSDDILSDMNKLNIQFVKLIKFARERNYKKVHMLFCTFCDYFDLPPNECYSKLHDKIQMMIKSGFVKLVGKSTYRNMNKRFGEKRDGYQPTLFDLVKNKQHGTPK